MTSVRTPAGFRGLRPPVRPHLLSPDLHLQDGRGRRWRWSTRKLRVHGLDGIRICDSLGHAVSLIGSNTNAPTIMIAEKASDLVRGNR